MRRAPAILSLPFVICACATAGQGPGEGGAPLVHHHGMDLFGPVGRRVLGAQRHRPLVHVDGPHPRPRCPPGKRCGDGPVATAEVQQRRAPHRRALGEQGTRARVHPIGGEHAGVGGEVERDAVGQGQAERPGTGARCRVRAGLATLSRRALTGISCSNPMPARSVAVAARAEVAHWAHSFSLFSDQIASVEGQREHRAMRTV